MDSSSVAPAFSVSKSTVEAYKIRHVSGCYWADITIDAAGSAGRISIASDYGSWENYWGACGCDFKQFLSKINEGYAATKFGVQEWLSVEGTVKLYRELVVSYRRDGTIDAEKARAIWEEIDGLAGESRHGLLRAFDASDTLSSFIYSVCRVPEFVNEPDPHFKRFWKEIWPVLLAEFAREATTATQATKGAVGS